MANTLIKLVFLLYLCQISSAYSAQLLRHNPYKKPEIEIVIPKPIDTQPDSTDDRPELWYPQLRATMRAGNNSMANINGEIIKIGETVDGFKLIKVFERKALFIKNKREYIIDMDQQFDEES